MLGDLHREAVAKIEAKSAVLGKIADHIGIIRVFEGCAYLPLIGILAIFLPDPKRGK